VHLACTLLAWLILGYPARPFLLLPSKGQRQVEAEGMYHQGTRCSTPHHKHGSDAGGSRKKILCGTPSSSVPHGDGVQRSDPRGSSWLSLCRSVVAVLPGWWALLNRSFYDTCHTKTFLHFSSFAPHFLDLELYNKLVDYLKEQRDDFDGKGAV